MRLYRESRVQTALPTNNGDKTQTANSDTEKQKTQDLTRAFSRFLFKKLPGRLPLSFLLIRNSYQFQTEPNFSENFFCFAENHASFRHQADELRRHFLDNVGADKSI
jgi:hypothetical protein